MTTTAARMALVLETLIDLFQAEDRPGGAAAVAALQSVDPATAQKDPHVPLPDDLDTAWLDQPVLNTSALAEATQHLHWHFSGLEDGRIREDIARRILTCRIIGPEGMIYHPTVGVGLFFQSAGVDYATRTHPAEETFIMLAGAADWTCNDITTHAVAGDQIFHPSNAPHKSKTTDRAFIAAWRWTGDIRFDQYRMIG